MKNTPNWQSVRDFIKGKKKILVTTHFQPDGDAIGSQLALAHYLRQCKVDAYMINMDPMPKFFHFLDPDNQVQPYNAAVHADLIGSMDGCMIVDISDWARLRDIGALVRQHRIPTACIDHHIPTDVMGDVQISVQEASSTGEILYQFLRDSDAEMTQTIVNALYMCILTDTGSFRFTNTKPLTMRIAADLLELGAEARKIYQEVYENNSKQRTQLMGHLLADMRYDCDDRVAYFILSQNALQEAKVGLWEIEGFSELARSIAGVEISLLFTETKDGDVKVSIRSKGHIPINGLAKTFGGGGHAFAAGTTIAAGLDEAIALVLKEVKKLFPHLKP